MNSDRLISDLQEFHFPKYDAIDSGAGVGTTCDSSGRGYNTLLFQVYSPASHHPINAESARLGVASPCLPVFQVTINSRLARVIPT